MSFTFFHPNLRTPKTTTKNMLVESWGSCSEKFKNEVFREMIFFSKFFILGKFCERARLDPQNFGTVTQLQIAHGLSRHTYA